MFDWEIGRVTESKLETSLEAAATKGYEIFAVILLREDEAESLYLVIARKPK